MAEDIALLVPVAVQQSPGTLCERHVSCNLRHECGRPASACLAACRLLSAAEPDSMCEGRGRKKGAVQRRQLCSGALSGVLCVLFADASCL